MKRVISLVFSILFLALAACAPSYSGTYDAKTNYYFFAFPIENGAVEVGYTIPANLPNPSRDVRAVLSCLSNKWLASSRAKNTVDEFLSYARSNTDFQVGDTSIAVKGNAVLCDGEAVKFQASNFSDAVGFIFGVDETSIGSSQGELVFRAFLRYLYPNIREDPYWSDIVVSISGSDVKARRSNGFYSRDAVVVLRQNGPLQSVLFEGQSTVAGFNPNETATLFVYRGRDSGMYPRWDVVSFNYAQGWLTWKLQQSAPTN